MVRRCTAIIITIIAVTVGLTFFYPRMSYAQLPPQPQIDRATREVDYSLREEAEEKLAPKVQTPSKEIKEEKVKEEGKGPRFFVEKIDLTGTVTVPVAAFRQIVQKYENKEIYLEDLEILADEIKREYLRKGIIAACFVPSQDVYKGTVILRVVEAKMGELKIGEHPFFGKDMIKFYWDIKSGEVIQYDKISKSLQLMNKNPDREVTASLKAGEKPETTDVLLDVKTHFPIHAFFSIDEEGAVTTGRARTGWGFRDNNFLFVDDTLLIGKTFGLHFDGVYAYHSIPITDFGTSVMYGYSDSKSVPKKEYNVFGIESRSQNTSVFINQDLYHKADYIGELSIGMDANDKVTHATEAGTLTRDRFRTLRIKSTFVHKYPGCVTYMTPQLSQGLNIFGARSKNPLSSRSGGADNNFTKFNLTLQHKRLLPFDLQASVKFDCQFASEKLASQEGFSIGGIDSVRGFPAQDFTGDWGFQTNYELLIPAFMIPKDIKIPYAKQTLKEAITGLVFLDQGYAQKLGPLEIERVTDSIVSVGAGVRIRIYKAFLRLEWGFPISVDRPITESEDSRLHFSLNFELP